MFATSSATTGGKANNRNKKIPLKNGTTNMIYITTILLTALVMQQSYTKFSLCNSFLKPLFFAVPISNQQSQIINSQPISC